MARPTRRKTSPGRRRPRSRAVPRRRWPLLVGGLVLAGAALYALATFQPGRDGIPEETIDEGSRAELESVLRETGD